MMSVLIEIQGNFTYENLINWLFIGQKVSVAFIQKGSDSTHLSDFFKFPVSQ